MFEFDEASSWMKIRNTSGLSPCHGRAILGPTPFCRLVEYARHFLRIPMLPTVIRVLQPKFEVIVEPGVDSDCVVLE